MVPSLASTMMADRISDLPDELLSHILSFLPTKLAFTTTVLSKRWTSLCYSLPALYFEFGWESCGLSEKHVEDTFYRFSHFVDTLMLSYLSTNKPLKTFLLICPFGKGKQYSNIFNAWFEAAKQLRVEEFHLTMFFHILNPITFISQTLVVLKLTWLDIGNDTSCVDLPSLKTLHLRYVYFKDRNDYIGFLSACPNLEDLHTEHVCPKNTSEGLKSLALPKLVGASIDVADAHFNLIKNVKFLRIFINQKDSIKVIQVFLNLIHIDLLFSHHSYHNWDHVVEVLRHSPKLQILSIIKSKYTTSSMKWKWPSSVIECVSTQLRSCTILNLEDSANDLRFTKYILQNACLLQDMKISVTTTNGMLLGNSEKSQILEELSSFPRISLGCKLSFE